ncbi:MAG: hypothetical protein JWO75_1131, partial [Actinomycetia bacterium]|nr:hypothetical protein [Actinomycetes bacterium]
MIIVKRHNEGKSEQWGRRVAGPTVRVMGRR